MSTETTVFLTQWYTMTQWFIDNSAILTVAIQQKSLLHDDNILHHIFASHEPGAYG